MKKQWTTVLDFIQHGKVTSKYKIVEVQGMNTVGDGGALTLVRTGNVGTPSQSFLDTGNNTCIDKNGDVWEVQKGDIVYFNGSDDWFGNGFGSKDEGTYLLQNDSWDRVTLYDDVGYMGLWGIDVTKAYKGQAVQTQTGGTPTGQYFTALQNTTVDPVSDDVNWREVVSVELVDKRFDKSSPSLLSLKLITPKESSNFVFIDGFSTSGDGGDCVWVKKGTDPSKAGDSFDLSLMEAYDASGNIYEPYGVYGTQKLEIKPNAVGAVGNFLNGTGKDNILELEALRDYLTRKGGGEIILDRFNVYGVSRSFRMGLSRNNIVHYQADLTSGFGKLDGFTASPATGATLDSVVRMNANDFTDTVGTFEGWQCSSFIVQGMDGSVDKVTCMSVVGAVRGSTIDNILTRGGYDGLALTSCFSHIFTRNRSENAHRKAHVMGSGEYGVINDVVVNASVYQGNVGRGAGDWGLHWLFGSANGCSGNTYELNDKNAWFQDLKNGAVSNLYLEGAQNSLEPIDLKIGGTVSESGIVANTSFDGVIAAFGGGKVVVSGAAGCDIRNFRLDSSVPITSDDSAGDRVVDNKFTNAPHDSTISKTSNETDTFTKGVANSGALLSSFKTESRKVLRYSNLVDVDAGVTTVILTGFKAVSGVIFGFNRAADTESFIDDISAISFGTVVAAEKNTRSSPPSRAYSVSGGNLMLNIPSDYEVFVVVDGVLFTG